jgi:hypothetical protein
MNRPENNGGPYKVSCSAAVAAAMKKLQQEVSAEGRRELLLAPFRHLVLRIQRYPTEFGEALYRFPALRLQVRSGVIPPPGVLYGVSEDQPLVFSTSVRLMAKPPEQS